MPDADNPERVLVLGGRGMLGTDVCATLRAQGGDVRSYDLPELDIRDSRALAEIARGCDAIVNCAAYTNVDGAEAEAELAGAVNATAVGGLGRTARELGIYVIHISTDFVFDGTLGRPYRETDVPAPLSTYGRTKLAGEQALAESGCNHCIVRVQWTYGRHGNNFVKKVLDRGRQSDELTMVADQVGSPTWTQDVSVVLAELLRLRPSGLFHYAAAGSATRLEVARLVLQHAGIDIPVRSCRTADFPASAQRPLNSRFDCAKIDAVLPARRPKWQESLRTFLTM